MIFDNLNDFINHYKEEALQSDIQHQLPRVYDILQFQQNKYENAEFESEYEEIKSYSEAALKKLKQRLQNALNNLQYNKRNKEFLIHIKIYSEYKSLYEKSKAKLENTNQAVYNTQYNIIDFLHCDLNFVLELLNEQIEQDDYKKYIITSNREILDSISLGTYLQKLSEPNHYTKSILKELLEKALKIIELDNDIMGEIEDRTRNKKIFHHIEFKKAMGFIQLSNNYDCIRINNIKKSFINLSTESNRDYFAKHHKYNIYESNDFAHKCGSIVNRICLFFGLGNKEDVNEFLSNGKLQPEKQEPADQTKNQHTHIFKDNAFEVWQYMFDNFKITESSRTDVKFIFEMMKKDLIHNTVSQKSFLEWISETYQLTIEKTSNPGITSHRMAIYNVAKLLYKKQDT